jgi:uncharacterized membrane protein
MANVFRSIGAVVAGMLLAFVLVMAVELFSSVVHPLPADFDGSMEQMCEHVARYPNWILVVCGAAWAGTALAGTYIAGRLGNRGSALFVGALLLVGVLFNISMLPYPIWFKVGIVIAIALAVAAGIYLSNRREPPAAIIENV